MKSHMQFSIYIDNIIKEFKNNKIKIEECENKLKKKSKILNNKDNNEDSYFIEDDLYLENVVNELNVLVEIENSTNLILEEDNNNININNNKHTVNWINNNKLSCAIDSFFTIFIYNLYYKLVSYDIKNKEYYYDEFNMTIFIYLIDFAEYIIKNYINTNFYLYEVYIKYYENKNLFNFLLLQETEVNQLIPITTIYRSLFNIEFFCIKYEKICQCNGYCQYKKEKKFILHSPPYIDITSNNLNNTQNKNVEDILINENYENKSKLCSEQECINSDKNIINISFSLLNLPIVLSFNISILNYNELKKYNDIINVYFTNNIKILNIDYNLAGIIFQKTIDNYVYIFNNLYKDSIINYKSWCFFDDIKGNIEILDNNGIAINNYRKAYPIAMIIYIKI